MIKICIIILTHTNIYTHLGWKWTSRVTDFENVDADADVDDPVAFPCEVEAMNE